MAKSKVKRQWEPWLDSVVVSSAGPNIAQIMLEQGEGEIFPGNVRFVRFLGCVSVFLSGWTAGDASAFLWHGLILVDADVESTSISICPGGVIADENEGSWLWREPINIWDGAHSVTANQFVFSRRFDMPVRGGKGSSIKPESRFAYVVGCNENIDSGINFTVNTCGLMLFAAD